MAFFEVCLWAILFAVELKQEGFNMVLGENRTAPAEASDFWDGFIKEDVAAEYLCQSTRTLQKWRVTGFGPQFYKPGRSVRYRRRDLYNWAETRCRASTSQVAA
ncbi:hypothetical protein U879_08390 [Defluviimonas sp. 20V17]|nr:hypothetical protein U879_08390 [Defluviimonas sp. 20V17]